MLIIHGHQSIMCSKDNVETGMGKYQASFNVIGALMAKLICSKSLRVTLSFWKISGAHLNFLATAVPNSVSRSYLLQPGQQ